MRDPKVPASVLPSRYHSLRMLVHARRLAGIMLPLGAGVGLLVAMALTGLTKFVPWSEGIAPRILSTLWFPAIGLFLTTLLLHVTKIKEVSLVLDLETGRKNPYVAFPFQKSLWKVVGCALTIGLGGSAGVEGPGKWLGSSLGLQAHRFLKYLAHGTLRLHLPCAHRLLLAPARIMVPAGAAAALAAVFRAPLAGALMAAEHDGRIHAQALVPCLVAAASGYLVFSGSMGLAPLIPLHLTFNLGFKALLWAMILGGACGFSARIFRWATFHLWNILNPVPLLWRGLVAGLGLVLLALPGQWLVPGLPITQGGGLELVVWLLRGETHPLQASIFLALKLLATALTFAGGGIGGQWLPSMAMGAALGALFEGFLGLPQRGLMVMVGAASLAGATHQTLLAPVVFLAETTGQAALVVPSLLGTTMAYLLMREQA